MTAEQIHQLHRRLSLMTEGERLALDPIAAALEGYQARREPSGWVVPNRVIALAAVDLMSDWAEAVTVRN